MNAVAVVILLTLDTMFMQEHWVAAVLKQHTLVGYISSQCYNYKVVDLPSESDLVDLLREKKTLLLLSSTL